MKKLIKKIIPKKIIDSYSKNKERKKLMKFKGDEVLCPICNSHFKKFGPYGLSLRENAECHNCGSLERHRLLWKYLYDEKQFFITTSRIKVLHFAPEKIFYDVFTKQEHIEYLPCDLSPEKYNYDGAIKIEKVDITKIPFQDNFFDFIICNHVLEHISDDYLAMSELYRVLKKDGCGIIQVPIDYNRESTYEDFNITTPEAREKAFGQHDHVRLYGKDYKQRLEKAGFNVTLDDYVKRFSNKEIFKFGFISTELIYNCSKD